MFRLTYSFKVICSEKLMVAVLRLGVQQTETGVSAFAYSLGFVTHFPYFVENFVSGFL